MNSLGEGLNSAWESLTNLPGSLYNNVLEPIGDGIIKMGSGIFGKNPNILGALDGWSEAGLVGKIGRIIAAPIVYAAHVGYNTTAMVGGTIMQPGSPIDLTYGAPATAFGLGLDLRIYLLGARLPLETELCNFKMHH